MIHHYLLNKIFCKTFNRFLMKNLPSLTLNCFIWYALYNTQNVNLQSLFCFISTNIEAMSKNKDIFKLCVSWAVTNILTFIPRGPETRDSAENILLCLASRTDMTGNVKNVIAFLCNYSYCRWEVHPQLFRYWTCYYLSIQNMFK